MSKISHQFENQATKTTTTSGPFFGGGGSAPFFQPKLTVNQPGDAHEREADAVADQVMRMREGDAPIVQRMPLTSVDGLMRKCSGCEEKEKEGIQRKETGGGDASGKAAPSIVSDVLSSGGGQPMESGTQQFMESRFGQDFSHVRIHTDARAAESASAIQARAYTSGRDVVFGNGEFQPSSESGRRLLAHELVHVGQQGGVQKSILRSALHKGNILFEGTCDHLACNSKYSCPDETNGISCPEGTRNKGKKMRPLFTCDNTCEAGATCNDCDDWMAMPKSKFKGSKCGQSLIICANEAYTSATVRDRSEREAWEVSPGIQTNLGVTGSFKGSIYADTSDPDFLKDKKCHPAQKSGSSTEPYIPIPLTPGRFRCIPP